jgi:hypothetical protein
VEALQSQFKIEMTSHDGKKWICVLPHLTMNEETNHHISNNESVEKNAETNKQLVQNLLSPLSHTCIFRVRSIENVEI